MAAGMGQLVALVSQQYQEGISAGQKKAVALAVTKHGNNEKQKRRF